MNLDPVLEEYTEAINLPDTLYAIADEMDCDCGCRGWVYSTAERAREFIDALVDQFEDEITQVAIDDCLDPHGYYVYVLWGNDKPIYVGRSSNILSRLGSHMEDYEKRTNTLRVQLIKCRDKDHARDTEHLLIGVHKPRLNIQGNPTAKTVRIEAC